MKTLPVTVKLNPKLAAYVLILEDSGFFGRSIKEVCERLICRQIEALAMSPDDNPMRARLHAAIQSE